MTEVTHTHASHHERHLTHRTGWLRAAVLGANDGLISTASLILGVAAANGTKISILVAGIAGVVAGSMSMAAGEYVSVSSQADSERADLEREGNEIEANRPHEVDELAGIYVSRGLESRLAHEVAEQLMEHDALGAHARDELGISEIATAKPVQAAVASAVSFAIGGVMPLLIVLVTTNMMMPIVAVSSLAFLSTLGAIGAKVGGAPVPPAAFRVTFWGALAMGVTAGIGALFGLTM